MDIALGVHRVAMDEFAGADGGSVYQPLEFHYRDVAGAMDRRHDAFALETVSRSGCGCGFRLVFNASRTSRARWSHSRGPRLLLENAFQAIEYSKSLDRLSLYDFSCLWNVYRSAIHRVVHGLQRWAERS